MASITERPAAPLTPTRKLHVGRRAFLATAATVTACSAGALIGPKAIPVLESKAGDIGRAAFMRELGSLEGVSLDAAIRAAEVTHAAVRIIVLPLARFISAMGTSTLALVLKAFELAHNAMALMHLDTAVLDAFKGVVQSWQRGVSSLPIRLDAYATADIESAEKYLRALQRMAEHPHLR